MDASQRLTKISGSACFSSLVLVADLYSVLYASDPRQSTESHESFRSHDLQASLPALLFNTLKSTFGIYVFSSSCCYCILSLAHHRRGLFLGLPSSDQFRLHNFMPFINWLSPGYPDLPICAKVTPYIGNGTSPYYWVPTAGDHFEFRPQHISLLPMAERFRLLCRAQRSRCLAQVSSLENDGAKLVMLANTHV